MGRTNTGVARHAGNAANLRYAPAQQPHGNYWAAIVVIGLALVVIAVLALLCFGSNATVTIIVPSQPLSVTMQYVTSTNQHTTQTSTIPSQALAYTASATGHGTATGTIQQGHQV